MHTSKVRTGNDLPGSIVHDHKLTLDFRQRPTWGDAGLLPGETFRVYDSPDPLLQATVVLPTGTVVVPCFTVKIATDAAGGAIDAMNGDTAHQPKYFHLFRAFHSAAEAQQSFSADAQVLGLSRAEIERAMRDLGARGVMTTSRVLHGMVRDWLSIEITLSTGDNGQVNADYEISIDVYHNPAIDKVLRNGVVKLDLTRRPTRADLGFLDTYRTARILPPWGTAYRATLTTRARTFDVPMDGMTSRADGPSGPPRFTSVSSNSLSVSDAHRLLRRSARTLGLDMAAVNALFRGRPSGTRVQKVLSGTTTGVYIVTVKVDVYVGKASLSYRFDYR